MSDGLPKPTSVEVGQWWRVPEHPAPHRVESVEGGYAYMTTTAAVGPVLFDSTLWPIDSMSLYSEYLGSGEYPEPTAWMLETLAEHAWSLYQADTMDPREWKDATNEERETRRSYARMIVHGGSGRTRFEHYAVKSLYRILRDLGKW